jgi:hypothetical protein
LQPLYDVKLTVDAFPIESGQVDGTLAHAIERLVGTLPDIVGMRSLCVAVDVPSHFNCPAPKSTLDEAAPEEEAVPEQPVIRGNLDGSTGDLRIFGWVARVGDDRPRSVRITIDGKPIATVVADRYRADLERVGYSKGRHAFSILAPSEYFDGIPHSVEAADEATGTTLGIYQTRFVRPQRHHDFEGFLRDSLINPEVRAPFREEDKRCFAAMEAIRARLCKRANPDHAPVVRNRVTAVAQAARFA